MLMMEMQHAKGDEIIWQRVVGYKASSIESMKGKRVDIRRIRINTVTNYLTA